MYNIALHIFKGLLAFASLFNKKAKLLYNGQKRILDYLKANIKERDRIIWVHCASLGEFEQGRPLIEKYKSEKPEYKILLTFFSPSGFEVRKNYEKADFISYLPIDTLGNARQFLDIAKPEKAIFVKYEFWANYLKTLKKRNIETYIISAIFRKEQMFFKSYGGFYRGLLKCFNHLFVQDLMSAQLLKSIGITNVTVAGDTRFDRVAQISASTKQIQEIESFKQGCKIFVCGSTWQPDEELLINYINNADLSNLKFIIAPHLIDKQHIENICSKINVPYCLFSNISKSNKSEKVLIVDCIGLLSSIYKYGQVAYIGGGFGVGIHNTLEAATFGLPVVFGPNYKRFKEAVDLINCAGGFTINNQDELNKILDTLIANPHKNGKFAKEYVLENTGATEKCTRVIIG